LGSGGIMEEKKRKTQTDYNREYMRRKRGAKIRENEFSKRGNTSYITAFLDPQIKEKLKKVALSQEMSVSSFVAKMIHDYLEK
jgi:hypothetical protein